MKIKTIILLVYYFQTVIKTLFCGVFRSKKTYTYWLFNNHSQFIEKVNQQGSNFFIIISLLFMTFNMIFNDFFSQKTTKDIWIWTKQLKLRWGSRKVKFKKKKTFYRSLELSLRLMKYLQNAVDLDRFLTTIGKHRLWGRICNIV